MTVIKQQKSLLFATKNLNKNLVSVELHAVSLYLIIDLIAVVIIENLVSVKLQAVSLYLILHLTAVVIIENLVSVKLQAVSLSLILHLIAVVIIENLVSVELHAVSLYLLSDTDSFVLKGVLTGLQYTFLLSYLPFLLHNNHKGALLHYMLSSLSSLSF